MTKSATKQSDSVEGLRRGDAIDGGRFVGDVPNGGSRWVSYSGDQDFRQMCETFDRIHTQPRKPARRAAAA